LRRSWLLSVVGVLAVVAGEPRQSGTAGSRQAGPGAWRVSGPEVLAPVPAGGPLLVLAAVTAAFLPMFDPAHRLAVCGPLLRFYLAAGPRRLGAGRSAGAGGRRRVHRAGPGGCPSALLLPSLALCAFTLAAATVMDPRGAAVAAAVSWALPALLLAASHVPLVIVQRTPSSRAPPCFAPLRWWCSRAVTVFEWDG